MLFILLLLLVVRAVTLPGAGKGVAFYLAPKFGDVTGSTFLTAIGQAFFSLSLGMGCMITYGSYLKNKENISDGVAWVVGLDTTVALIAGFAIFPAVFALGFDPAAGAGLAFITLPAVFSQMPLGNFFGFVFFLLLLVAALTSAISLLEVVVAWLVDEKGWPRIRASAVMGIAIFALGIPASLGYSALSGITPLGMELLDFYDFTASELALPVGGALTAIFAGHVWKTRNVLAETADPPGKIRIGAWYGYLIGWIVPAAILVVLLVGLIRKFG